MRLLLKPFCLGNEQVAHILKNEIGLQNNGNREKQDEKSVNFKLSTEALDKEKMKAKHVEIES